MLSQVSVKFIISNRACSNMYIHILLRHAIYDITTVIWGLIIFIAEETPELVLMYMLHNRTKPKHNTKKDGTKLALTTQE